jgi:hypothetical protein
LQFTASCRKLYNRGRCIWSLAVYTFCGNPRRAYTEPVRFTAPRVEPVRFIAHRVEPMLRFASFIYFARFIYFATKKHLNKYFLNL